MLAPKQVTFVAETVFGVSLLNFTTLYFLNVKVIQHRLIITF